MANFFTLQFGALNPVSLSGIAVNKSDANLYINVFSTTDTKITPLTNIKAIIAPDALAWDEYLALDALQSSPINNPSQGIYTVECQNNTDEDIDISFRDIVIRANSNREYPFENTKYNVYWLVSLGTSSIQGSASGFYTLPHNIQPSEIRISGSLMPNNIMRYNVKWNGITNEDSVYYGGLVQPYVFSCRYPYDRENPLTPIIDEVGYPAGTMPTTGITFDTPFNYLDTLTPNTFEFWLSNHGPGGDSSIKTVVLRHNDLTNTNNYFNNLDDTVFSSVNREGIRRVGEFPIDKDVIDRRRLSIGINDVAVKDNTFVKQGTYISPYYPLDGNLYTLSLNVDELIPPYSNLNPYNIIKYFIEVNSIWEAISPLSREDEFDSEQNLIPKIFVFDRGINKNSQVKYFETSLIKIIRVKIVFDLSQVSGDKFTPPEVRDYKCIIYDKDQLNEF